MDDISSCVAESWSPVIGDPTALGWITVVAYIVCAALSLSVLLRASFPEDSRLRERVFWGVVFLILCFLGVNKQLDLQTGLTSALRCMAKIQGWYGNRRLVQGVAIVGLGLGALWMMGWLFWMLRGSWRRNALPILGLGVLIGFVLMRAVGLRHFDTMINWTFLSMRLNGWLELSGLVLIGAGALLLLRK